MKKRLQRLSFALFSLAILAFTSSLAFAEVITYDYDNAGQVKRVRYDNQHVITYKYDNSGNMTSKYINLSQPDISASPAALDFGSIHVGSTPSPQTITVTNNGIANLVISSVTIGGPFAGLYAIHSNTCAGSLQPLTSCSISVKFVPTTSTLSSGNTASLSIVTNDPDTPAVSIPLSGRAYFTLTTVKAGPAAGNGIIYDVIGVGQQDNDIYCGNDCTENYYALPNSYPDVYLDHTGSCIDFTSWSGCTLTSTGCVVTMNSDETVIGTFDVAQPIADFTSLPSAGRLPLSVQFTDLSSCATSWLWNFGDGYTSTGRNPSHVYSNFGAYSVSLTATAGSKSDIETKPALINVLCQNDPVRIIRGTSVLGLYASLQAAYDYATNNDVIESVGQVFMENLTLDLPISVIFTGGLDCNFSPITGGYSVIEGNVAVTDGSVQLREFKIE